MKIKDALLYSKFHKSNYNINPKHISSQFVTKEYKKPIMENSKPIIIAPSNDKDGISKAYSRDSKIICKW